MRSRHMLRTAFNWRQRGEAGNHQRMV